MPKSTSKNKQGHRKTRTESNTKLLLLWIYKFGRQSDIGVRTQSMVISSYSSYGVSSQSSLRNAEAN